MAALRTARVLALAGLLGALGAGCGDSGTPEAERTATPSSSPSDSTPTETTPTETETTESTESTATVAPADGKPISLPSLTGAFPAGWRIVDRTSGSSSAGDTDPMTGGFIFISDLKNLGSEDFDEKVAIVMEHYAHDKTKPERGENRVVDGVEGWVIEGASDSTEVIYEFGTFIGGQDVHFTFSFQFAPKDAMAIIDSVLASVHWR
jgi:hypothetical protein